MPFPVDNIRSACALRKTSLKQLEKDLGIGNGVIARWENAKGYPPYDRIVAIAEHLNVSVDYLTGEKQKEKPAPQKESGLNPKYYELNQENQALVDSMIEKLLKSQSGD